MAILDNLEAYLGFGPDKIPGYKQTPPDWCDDCISNPGEKCPDCGCTHNC